MSPSKLNVEKSNTPGAGISWMIRPKKALPKNPWTDAPGTAGPVIHNGHAAGEPAAWPLWITGPAVPGASVQGFFGNAFFGRIIQEIPAPGVFDFSTFNFDGDMAAADAKSDHTFNATDPE